MAFATGCNSEVRGILSDPEAFRHYADWLEDEEFPKAEVARVRALCEGKEWVDPFALMFGYVDDNAPTTDKYEDLAMQGRQVSVGFSRIGEQGYGKVLFDNQRRGDYGPGMDWLGRLPSNVVSLHMGITGLGVGDTVEKINTIQLPLDLVALHLGNSRFGSTNWNKAVPALVKKMPDNLAVLHMGNNCLGYCSQWPALPESLVALHMGENYFLSFEACRSLMDALPRGLQTLHLGSPSHMCYNLSVIGALAALPLPQLHHLDIGSGDSSLFISAIRHNYELTAANGEAPSLIGLERITQNGEPVDIQELLPLRDRARESWRQAHPGFVLEPLAAGVAKEAAISAG